MGVRTSSLVAAVVLVLAAAGCGDPEPDTQSPSPVRLSLDAPADRSSVDAETVEVRGRVRPASARVLVAGDEVRADGGSFSATVALEPGTNIIDVVAGAPGRRSATRAVRVVRIVEVAVPDVAGRPPSEAVRTLRRAGLDARTRRSGGLLDALLPGSDGVCGTDPPAGERVLPGTEVEVVYAKAC
jgi:hypothetical protein